jgi:hypothetical protein
MAGLRIEDLVERPPVLANPDEPSGRNLPVLTPRLGRTETASREADERVLAVGRPVDALKAWLEAAGSPRGRCSARSTAGRDRRLRPRREKHQRHRQEALRPRRARSGGVFGPRPALGCLTEVARRGAPLPEAMRHSRHRSVQQAAAYYHEVAIERGRSARLA